jgi:drug/metabolite transporter (DMT)-like permease
MSGDAGLWPVALERSTATLTLATIALALTRGALTLPTRLARLVVTIALLEVCATVPLLLALQRGPVAIASVLASLYPVTTVLLAATVLHERMSRLQLAGVCLALVAVVLVSAG